MERGLLLADRLRPDRPLYVAREQLDVLAGCSFLMVTVLPRGLITERPLAAKLLATGVTNFVQEYIFVVCLAGVQP